MGEARNGDQKPDLHGIKVASDADFFILSFQSSPL
jgi:hypothetical protein